MFPAMNPFSKMENTPKADLSDKLRVLFTGAPPEISDFPPEKRQRMVEAFVKNLASLPSDMQAVWMEKFLEANLIDDGQLLDCVKRMHESAAIKTGNFVAKILDINKYPKTLRFIYPELEYSEQKKILELALDNPELIVTLALHLYTSRKLMDVAVQLPVDYLQRIMQVLTDEKSLSPEDFRQMNRRESLREMAKRFYEINPLFLLPYLDALKAVGLNEYTEGRPGITPVAQKHAYSIPIETYLKSGEKQSIPEDQRHPKASVNFCEHIFSNYESSQKFMTPEQEMEFLLNMIDLRVPIFLRCAKLGREKTEQLLIKNRALKYNGFPFALDNDREYAAMQAAGMEDLAYRELELDLDPSSETSGYETLEYMPYILHRMAPNLREKMREKILAFPKEKLKGHVKILLAENLCTLDQALKELDFENLNTQLLWLMDNYQDAESRDKIRSRIKEIFSDTPHFYFDTSESVRNFLPPKDRKEIEAAFFDLASPWSFNDFLDKKKDELHRYAETIKVTISKHPLLILFGSPERYLPILGRESLLETELKCLAQADLDNATLASHLAHICSSRQATEKAIQISLQSSPNRQALILSALERVTPGSRKNAKGLEVANEPRKTYTEWLNKLRQAYYDNCAKEPTLLLETEGLKVSQVPLHHLTEEVLEGYLNNHPWKISNIYQRFFRYGKNGPIPAQPVAIKVLRHHVRTAAFFGELVSQSHPDFSEIKNAINQMDPIRGLELRRSKDGRSALSSIEDAMGNNIFYAAIEADVEEMKEKSLNEDGYLNEKSPYFKKVKQCLLLENSPFAKSVWGILSKTPSKERLRLMDLLATACSFELDYDMAVDQRTPEALAKKLTEALKNKLLELLDLKDLGESSGVEWDLEAAEATTIYYSGRCTGIPVMKNALRDFVSNYLSGTEKTYRAWGLPKIAPPQKQRALDRMKKRELLPKQLSLEQYETWLEDAESGLDEVVTYDTNDIFDGVKNALGQAVADGHVPSEMIDKDWNSLQSELQKLYAPLSELDQRIKPLSQKKEKAKKAKRQGGDVQFTVQEEAYLKDLYEKHAELIAEIQPQIDRLKAEMTVQKLKNLSPEELSSRSLQLGRWRMTFDQAFKLARGFYAETAPEFIQDLERIKEILDQGHERVFGQAKTSRLELKITDSFNFKDYIRIGEEPVPSCQNSDSKGFLNQGLLSYVVDPNVRIIRIFDQTGRLTTRCVLRLLEDGQGQPCLFMERVYTTNSHKKITEAIINLALRKAKNMGIDLYIDKETPATSSQTSQETLFSHGSRSAFVYTDSGGGLREDGVFQVHHPNKIPPAQAATKAA